MAGKSSRSKGALSAKEKIFVAEYMIDENGTRAAIAAGYARKSAHVTASRLLKSPKIKAHLVKKEEKRLERLEISADRVLQETARLAFLDPRKLYHPDGRLKQITELDDHTAAAIAGIDVEDVYEDHEYVGQVKKIKFADKGANLQRLGNHLKLFTTKVEHSGTVKLETMDDAELKDRLKKALAELNG
jgi:phage terminase small subunit